MTSFWFSLVGGFDGLLGPCRLDCANLDAAIYEAQEAADLMLAEAARCGGSLDRVLYVVDAEERLVWATRVRSGDEHQATALFVGSPP